MIEPRHKLMSLDRLREQCATWSDEGKIVVLANGAFDLLHVGHVRYLAAARALGDRLVVAVNSDRSVRFSKGPERPILPVEDRVEVLSHLSMIDRLVVFDTPTLTPVLEALKPPIHAKGTDYTVETVPEREVVRAYGGRTAICGDPKDHATSDLIATIVARFGDRGR